MGTPSIHDDNFVKNPFGIFRDGILKCLSTPTRRTLQYRKNDEIIIIIQISGWDTPQNFE